MILGVQIRFGTCESCFDEFQFFEPRSSVCGMPGSVGSISFGSSRCHQLEPQEPFPMSA